MKGILLCITDFLRKTFSTSFFSLCFLACLALSVGFYSNASAGSIDIGNPQVSWTRQYTTQSQFPIVTTSSGISSIPFSLNASNDVFISYIDLHFDVSGSFNRYTTISGGTTISYGAISGGDHSQAEVIVYYTSGKFSVYNLPIYSNHLSDYPGPYVVYAFNIQLPDNSQISGIDYKIGKYCSTTLNNCSIPLGSGSTMVQALWAHIETENDAGTDAIIGELGDLNDTINHPDWVDEQNDAVQDAYDNAQSDFEDNSDIAQISNKVSTLLGVLTSAVTAVSNPSITNCIIPFDLSRYSGGVSTDVDLCYLSPPSGITNVLNVIVVGFMIVVIVSLIRSIFALYREVITN